MKDKFIVTYGFHPREEYSRQIGKRLKNNPPKHCDVMYFRPHSITHDHVNLSWSNQVKQSYAGRKELRDHVLQLYKKLPVIVELHDTELYNTTDKNYMVIFSKRNMKLGKILTDYQNSNPDKKIMLECDVDKHCHSITLEYFPVNFQKEVGEFRTLTVKQGAKFARDIIEFLYKNRGRF